MNTIESMFREEFETWGIELPPKCVAERRRGRIRKAGWTIDFVFGSNENGEYLDYYATHRMTNEQHVRLYASGESEGLPASWDMRLVSEDPVEDKALEEEYLAHERRVEEILARKGWR